MQDGGGSPLDRPVAGGGDGGGGGGGGEPDGRIRVLFMQSQAFFGSDSMIHSLAMRCMNRDRVEVFVACNRGTRDRPSKSLLALREIPDIVIRETNFGPSRHSRSTRDVVKDTIKNLGFPLDIVRLIRFARAHDIDVVHGTEKPRDAIYGYIVARCSGAKAITHVHVKVESWINSLVRRIMRRDDGLVAVSQFIADSATKMGYDPAKTHVVLNAIDATDWNPEHHRDGDVRATFGIAPEVPVVVIAARIFPWKGHESLLRALAVVRDRDIPFHLLVVGTDDPRATPGGGSYTDKLRTITTELSLDPHVTFTGFRSDVKSILANTDVYAMPTFEEPCAVAFLEAMAMALPVVATRSGGTVQLVDDGTTGFLSETDDIEGLADNLARLLSDADLRRAVGDAGRRRVLEHFTPQRFADDVEAVYREVLGHQPAT